MGLQFHRSEPTFAMAPDANLERLYPVVFGDPVLRDRLIDTADRAEFCQALSDVAGDHGIVLPSESVDLLLHTARRRWLERER